MIYLIIVCVILLCLSYYLYRQNERNKAELSRIKPIYEFTNKVPRRLYLEFIELLKSKRGRLSSQSKIEIINIWTRLLLLLPSKYNITVDETAFNIKDDKSTLAEHKKLMIENLEALSQNDYLEKADITALYYHLICILIK